MISTCQSVQGFVDAEAIDAVTAGNPTAMRAVATIAPPVRLILTIFPFGWIVP
jgi:hypothetical protein